MTMGENQFGRRQFCIFFFGLIGHHYSYRTYGLLRIFFFFYISNSPSRGTRDNNITQTLVRAQTYLIAFKRITSLGRQYPRICLMTARRVGPGRIAAFEIAQSSDMNCKCERKFKPKHTLCIYYNNIHVVIRFS